MTWTRHLRSLFGSGRLRDAPEYQPPAFAHPCDVAKVDEARTRGIEQFRAGSFESARHCFLAGIALGHDDPDLHNWLGLAHLKLGDLDDANDSFVLASHFRPDFAEAWYNLAMVARRRGDHHSAIHFLERAIAVKQDYAEAHNALGASALAGGMLSRAVASFEQAVVAKPEFAHAHSNLGYLLFRDCGEYARGAAHLKTALELSPDDPSVLCNYTIVLAHEGRLDEVVSVCNRILTLRPDFDEARLNRALARLRLGIFELGWPDYEARKRVRSNYVPRPYRFPEWDGKSLAGKTILVYAEQGIGDEIMFSSCVSEIGKLATRCVLECSPRLESLFKRSFPGITVVSLDQASTNVTWLDSNGPFDYQLAAGSLPGFFRRRFSDFPRHSGYLRSDRSRAGYWRKQLAELGPELKIGIAWRGGLVSTRSSLRSTRLPQWLPLLGVQKCRFVCLQHDATEAEIGEITGNCARPIHHWRSTLGDLDDTAALISMLDLVVSVQTATVHLAGALGTPTWVLVPAVPEWRYLQQGDTMPWYPSVELFRQDCVGEWDGVLELVADRLKRKVSS